MENTIVSRAQKNLPVVAFKLNRRTFALPLEVIVQILPMMTITPIPHFSSIVKGTVNIRGEDVLVVSLRGHFNMEEAPLQLYTPLLLLKLKNRSLALIVDAVLDVMNLPLETMTDIKDMLPEGIEDLPMLQGVSRFNDDTILVLSPDNLFYNHRTLLQQSPAELITSAPADMPAAGAPIEDALVSMLGEAAEAPALEKKPAAKKVSAKKMPAAKEAPSVAQKSDGAENPVQENS